MQGVIVHPGVHARYFSINAVAQMADDREQGVLLSWGSLLRSICPFAVSYFCLLLLLKALRHPQVMHQRNALSITCRERQKRMEERGGKEGPCLMQQS